MQLVTESVYWNGGSTPCFVTIEPASCYPTGGFAAPGTPNSAVAPGHLGVNPNPSFGQLTNINLDPNFHREYDWQYNIGVQQQVWRGVTASFTWNRVGDYQQQLLINEAVPSSAWTPTTVYNLQSAYNGLTPILHETNAPQSLRSNYYQGFETAITGRLPRGAF